MNMALTLERCEPDRDAQKWLFVNNTQQIKMHKIEKEHSFNNIFVDDVYSKAKRNATTSPPLTMSPPVFVAE